MNPSQGDAWYSLLFLQSWILPSVISRYEAYKYSPSDRHGFQSSMGIYFSQDEVYTNAWYSPLITMDP